jgi:peptidyl-tRNA hydrolase, PTH2 family
LKVIVIIDREGSYKQVIVVRKDLGMGTGKLAAQVAHAAVMAVEITKMRNLNWFNSWFKAGQAKVVVKVQTLGELLEIRKHAESLRLTVAEIQDSGLTQIPAGTVTCIGIGPGPSGLIDKVTNHLKLL